MASSALKLGSILHHSQGSALHTEVLHVCYMLHHFIFERHAFRAERFMSWRVGLQRGIYCDLKYLA